MPRDVWPLPRRDSAECAYQGVINRGYSKDDVDLVMSDQTRQRHFGSNPGTAGTTGSSKGTELGTKAAEGAGIGAGTYR